MSGRDVFMALSTVLGGLALFLLGMSIMTDGLQQAAGFGQTHLEFEFRGGNQSIELLDS